MIHKPLIEGLSGGSGNNLGLDPDTVARAFGFGAVHSAVPVPDNPLLKRQVANTSDNLIDRAAKKPAPKPSLLSIVTARLESITPLSKEHQQLVTKMRAKVVPQLAALDAFIAEIKEARYIAIETRWEEIRAEGRKLVDSLPALNGQLGEARRYCNQALEAKGRHQVDAEQKFAERTAMNGFTWASKEELAAAARKLERAKEAATLAKQKWIDEMRAMAVVEGKIASVNATLESFQNELQRLALELSGEAHFDQEFGLSSEPRFYTEEEVSGRNR